MNDKPTKTMAELDNAISLKKSELAQAYNDRGKAWFSKNKPDKAKADFNEAIRLNPDDLDTAIRLNPDDAEAWFKRGLVRLSKNEPDKGDPDKAISDFDEAIRLKRNHAAAYCNRGFAWFAKGETKKADADFENVVKLGPKALEVLADALRYRITVQNLERSHKKIMDTITKLDEAIRVCPGDKEYWIKRGSAWDSMGQYDKADADYREARKLDETNYFVWVRRGELYTGDSDIDMARYTEIIRQNPNTREAWFYRGNGWLRRREHDKAIADYNEHIRLRPDSVEALHHRGNIWRIKGKYDKAIEDYTAIIRLAPYLSAIWDARGDVWESKGEQEKAQADFDEASRLREKANRIEANREKLDPFEKVRIFVGKGEGKDEKETNRLLKLDPFEKARIAEDN